MADGRLRIIFGIKLSIFALGTWHLFLTRSLYFQCQNIKKVPQQSWDQND